MNCRQFRQFYSDFADGLLNEAEDVAFDVHMAECENCRRFHAALQHGRRTLQHLKAPHPSEDFDSRLFERILQECEQDAAPMRQWSGLAGAALVVVLLGVVGWEARSRMAPRHEVRPASRPGSSAVEPFVVRFAGDTSLRYPGRLPVLPVSRDTFRSATRPAQSFEITVDWMTP